MQRLIPSPAWRGAGVLLLVCLLLSGCMYPKELRKENQVASSEYLMLVQHAIDQYKEKTGVLPIKNSKEETPIYEKYAIDFKKLKDRYLSAIPANAFENGGTAIYVLVDVEQHPTVKMMDLIAFQKTVELQRLVDEYRTKNAGQLPRGEEVAPGFWTVDFAKLNRQAETVPSVYTRQLELPFLLHDSGALAIDYAADIMRLIDRKQLQDKLDGEQDLRALLVEEYPFVPARSYPYRWQDDRPVPVTAPR